MPLPDNRVPVQASAPRCTPGTWRIREASRDDSVSLAQLFRQEAEFHQQRAGYYTLQPDFDWRAYVARHLARDTGAIWVADDGGRLLGFLWVRIVNVPGPRRTRSLLRRLWHRPAPQPSHPLQPLTWAVIEACYVLEARRSQGIGVALVAQAQAWCQQRGIQRIELGVLSSNTGASAFWTKQGFQPYRVGMHQILPEGMNYVDTSTSARGAGRGSRHAT